MLIHASSGLVTHNGRYWVLDNQPIEEQGLAYSLAIIGCNRIFIGQIPYYLEF